jgi:hypothetical protein
MRYRIATTGRGQATVRALGLRAALVKAAPVLRVTIAKNATTDGILDELTSLCGDVTITISRDADDELSEVTAVTEMPTPTPEVQS